MTPFFRIDGEISEASPAALAGFLNANPGPCELHINSPGGNAFAGADMLAQVEAHGSVTTRIRGLAASAASLVAVAGKVVTIAPAGLVMIHDPMTWGSGNGADLRRAADAIEKIGETYAAAYARLTGHPVARIRQWMRDETWMTAEEALSLHFADEIEPGAAEPIAAPAIARACFRSAPAELSRLSRAQSENETHGA